MLISTKLTRRILLGLLACTLLITPTVSFASVDANETVTVVVDDAGESTEGASDRGSF